MLALLAALQLQAAGAVPLAAPTAAPDDSLPAVTLAEALRRAAGLDPDYVQAIGQVDNAVWARRSAFAVFILPSVALSTQANQYAPAFFNFATLRPEKYAVQAQVSLQYDLFTGGQKVAELTRSAAALDGAHAGELRARFATALATESIYYAVLAGGRGTRRAGPRARQARPPPAPAPGAGAAGAGGGAHAPRPPAPACPR